MKPPIKLILPLILLFFVSLLNAQVNQTSKTQIKEIEKNKSDFENTFIENFQPSFSNNNPKDLVNTSPCYLPTWMLNPPKATNDNLYIIGISDPGMDSITAVKLAALRAKTIIVLLNNSNIKNVTDFYSNIQSQTHKNMFEYYSQIFASYNIGNEIIVKNFYTKYNEAIVLIKIPTNDTTLFNKDSITVNCELYKMDMNMEYGTQYEAMFSINTKKYNGDTCSNSNYVLTEVNGNSDVLTEYLDNKITIPNYYFNYKIFENDSSHIQLKADTGLWKEYIKSILLDILNLSQINSIKIKTFAEDYSSIYEKMTREISNNNLQFNIEAIQIINNKLDVQLNIKESSLKSR